MKLKNNIHKYKETAVVSFAQQIIDKLRAEPIYTYTDSEIARAKHPEEECVFCGQKGCNSKHSGHFVHSMCVEYTNKEVLKRQWKLKKP